MANLVHFLAIGAMRQVDFQEHPARGAVARRRQEAQPPARRRCAMRRRSAWSRSVECQEKEGGGWEGVRTGWAVYAECHVQNVMLVGLEDVAWSGVHESEACRTRPAHLAHARINFA